MKSVAAKHLQVFLDQKLKVFSIFFQFTCLGCGDLQNNCPTDSKSWHPQNVLWFTSSLDFGVQLSKLLEVYLEILQKNFNLTDIKPH